MCLGCHEKPPKIQYTKILRLSWHTVTLAGLSFAFGITTDSIKQKDIRHECKPTKTYTLKGQNFRVTWPPLLSTIYHLQLYRIRLCSFLQAVKIWPSCCA